MGPDPGHASAASPIKSQMVKVLVLRATGFLLGLTDAGLQCRSHQPAQNCKGRAGSKELY